MMVAGGMSGQKSRAARRRPGRALAAALLASGLALGLWTAGCSDSQGAGRDGETRVLVLGMDGLDPDILQRLMAEDKLPNFSRLAARGQFHVFGTAMPPQSPVAWSNFISGSTPGKHQIFDFIHRDPNPGPSDDGYDWPIKPYSSMSEAFGPKAPEKALRFGQWRIPLESGGVINLRKGDAFWNHLLRHGVDVTIYRMPANYPPPTDDEVPGPGTLHVLSGMGTPDVLGGYGDFTEFVEEWKWSKPKVHHVPGGIFRHLEVIDNQAVAELPGPPNYLRQPDENGELPPMTVELKIVRDPVRSIITLTVGDEKRLLRQGEWSNWIPIEFKTGIPGSAALDVAMPTSVRAIIRVYAKQVYPTLTLYVSALNIDPANPVNPISYPPEWAAEIAATTGAGGMYTTGIPEDTKALRSGALNEDEFLQMVHLLVDERTRQYHAALQQFKRGFLYFYFGHTDQLAHMFWRDIDPDHPGRRPEQEGKYTNVIYDTYVEMDQRLGEALAALDDNDVLIVMSDHGFTSFRRGFNVNTWLVKNGYMKVHGLDRDNLRRGLLNIIFPETRAYAVGINGLYINLKGREKYGIVDPADKRRLMEELVAKLEQVRDEDGHRVIEKVYITEDLYPDADPRIAPDLLIGYERNYRGSWRTALGGMGRKILEDNKDRWSGDHCIALDLVPGVILSNVKLTVDDPELSDLGPSVLSLFGIDRPDTMTGRVIFGQRVPLPAPADGEVAADRKRSQDEQGRG